MGIRHDRFGFLLYSNRVKDRILIPKYYDPDLIRDLESLNNTHELVPFAKLVEEKIISLKTGDEIGKMAYGTGEIPFIRTSDISNWELKSDPKQGISNEVYDLYKDKQDVRAEDILLVRDGTYLVGTSCILTEQDTQILYCGGIYKIRCVKRNQLNPYLLFGLLNTAIVKRQIRSKQFTRDIIDTLGKRLMEIELPMPKNEKLSNHMTLRIKELITKRSQIRSEMEYSIEKLETL